jgi:2,3-bisphosphoglycerate-independent phosphoglycerate mutase
MYQEDPKITDQYLPAFVIAKDNQPIGTIQDNDAVVFFNFRGDRSIEITMAFEQADFKYFDRERFPKVFYAGMMQYDGDLHLPHNYLVSPPQIQETMSEYLCAQNLNSFAISETQKFGHVTYFWNGNKSGYICQDKEEYDEIPSDKINFDQAPKMKAMEITEKTLELLRTQKFQIGRINLANGDMVGHTGIMDATITAVETVDTCVGKLVELVKQLHGITIITADHGNADEMFTVKNGVKSPKTSHTLNPVPFVIVDTDYQSEYTLANTPNAGLANVAATVFNLLGYEKPKDYEPSLIKF